MAPRSVVGLALAGALLVHTARAAADPACFALLPDAPAHVKRLASSLRASGGPPAPITCPPAGPGVPPRFADLCFLACGLCTVPELALGLDPAFADAYCGTGRPLPASDPSSVVAAAAGAVLNATALQGTLWIEDNVTVAYEFLLAGMPRRDVMLLFSQTFTFLDFLSETVRMALTAWPLSSSWGVPWDIFLANVIPYAFLDEKRDVEWRWRPRFFRALMPLILDPANNVTSATGAMRVIAAAIPSMQSQGLVSLLGEGGGMQLMAGPPITWISETSPGYLSPSQVASHGASCTGTGIVLAAAARSVGIPARLAGCSESVVRGDDHHWAEFYDASAAAGPFGDGWHTKEGVSAGNAGGPWDSPSGPMLGCLQGVVPGSSLDTLWASSWGSATYLPALWANDAFSVEWAFAGGENRCGAYCSAWGCGANNTQHWAQGECGPAAAAATATATADATTPTHSRRRR